MLLVLSAGGVTACTVGPDYVQPDVDVPEIFETVLTGTDDGDAVPDLSQWWTRFEDPMLDELIERAEAGNYDLKRAVAAIEQYRAGFGLAESQLYPSISLGGAYSRVRTNSAQLGGLAEPEAYNAWTYGLDLATWEIDVFGKLRRSIESSQGEYQASVEDWRNVLVALRAEVASAYIGLRVLQSRRAVAASLRDVLTRQLQISRDRLRAGTVTELDVIESETALASASAQIPVIDAEISQQLNAISVLAGDYPGELVERLAEMAPIPRCGTPFTTGVPAQLLLNRPDLRSAERRLAARVAAIGVAVAGLYPEISLVGSVGIFATDLSGLGNADNLTYRAGPQITWNFFNGGLTQAQIQQAEAAAAAAEVEFRAAVLAAVAQVETAAGNIGFAAEALGRLDRGVAEGRRGIGLATSQYEAGTIDLDRLLGYERLLLQLEDQQVQMDGVLGQNVVELCRALGGDWSDAPLPDAARGAYPEDPTADEPPSAEASPAVAVVNESQELDS